MLADRVLKRVKGGSAIRAAFNKAEEMRSIYGDTKVFDLSIGNPGAPVPEEVRAAIASTALDPDLQHSYMCDAGYPSVRRKIATSLNTCFNACCTEENIIMTSGAAGALNSSLYTLVDPGDEVIVLAPYYPAYTSFITNFSGRQVTSYPKLPEFTPDLEDLESKINSRTKAVIVNSPNNPSGVVYDKNTVRCISELLKRKQHELGHTIYVISDEPYRELLFNDQSPVWWPDFYENTIVIYSFSKSLSIPGERIGYMFIPGAMDDFDITVSALRSATGALGYVNAPAFFQRVAGACADLSVNVDYYRYSRDLLTDKLRALGFEFPDPQGAFYIFLKVPSGNEEEFLSLAQSHGLIFVPGSAFGLKGYMRISFCGSHDTIERSIPYFDLLAKDCSL